jgi:hypothetical protein
MSLVWDFGRVLMLRTHKGRRCRETLEGRGWRGARNKGLANKR